jgi:serine/threonine protein kinase/DNA-binding SARP family transcriptional activator
LIYLIKIVTVSTGDRMEVNRLFLFGHPRLERDGQPVTVNRRKMIALLSYLLITRQPHSREALATLLWPDFDPSSALANLRRDLSRLKETLGAGLLQIEREKVQVNPEADLWLDVWQFEDTIQQIEQHQHLSSNRASPPDCSHCQALREAAAGLYNGDFMAGFNLPDSPAFDDWQFYHSERLRGQLADVLVQIMGANIAQGSYEKAIEPARRWLALDPLHEPAQRMLMQLYAWAAQPTAALRQYNLLVDLMQQELGAEPEAETTSLYEAIRSRRLETPAPLTVPPPLKTPSVPDPTSATAEPQQKITSRFRVESLLSSGGFGEIYRGYDQQTGNTVAIKRLHPQLVASNPMVVERFVREGQALSQLSHPNIIPLLAFYEHEGSYNLVMEYLPGGTLRNRLERENALPVEQAVEIALELADALSRAHHLHILHRDLKPENILLDGDGHPRLIDFGLAQLQGNDSRLTQAGMLLGSPAYMSPEAIQGKELDQRSDIWSFGVLLFEMLAGRLPFEGEQFHSLMNQILNQEAPSLQQYCPDVHPALAQLVASMLEKDRDQRLPGIRQAAAQLEAIRAGKAALLHGANSGKARTSKSSTPTSPTYLVELPHQPAPIVGRDSELDDLIELLRKPEVRLVTLVGTGGIGKTRLAVEVASQMAKT